MQRQGPSAPRALADPQARRVTRVCVAAGAGGGLVLAMVLYGSPAPWRDPVLFAGFAVVLALLEVVPLRLTHREEAESLQVEEAFFVPMALLLSPGQTLLALGVAVAFAGLWTRRGWLKLAFNTGMIVATAGMGLGVAGLLGASAPSSSLSVATVGAAALGGLVFCALSSVAVAGIIALAQHTSFRATLFDGFAVRAATWTGSLSLGVLVVMAADGHRWALAVVLVPVGVLQLAYAGALQQWRERRQVEQLYQAATSIQSTIESREVRRELMDAAARLVGATSVSLVPADLPVSGGVLRANLDDDLALEVAGRVGGGQWRSSEQAILRALAGVATGALHNALLFEQIEAITASLGEGVLGLDATGHVTFVNPAAERLLGRDRDALLGRTMDEVIAASPDAAGPDGVIEWRPLRHVRVGRTVRDAEDVFIRADGSAMPVAFTASPVVRDGEVAGAVVAFRDVTERKAFEAKLTYQAYHDALTGLPNRAWFLERLDATRSHPAGTQALLFVDLDRVKVVNDSLGHRAGDELLVAAAGRLAGCMGEGCRLARFGGDEFTILVEDVVHQHQVTALAERILAALRTPFMVRGREVFISASIGIALGTGPEHGADDLLCFADIAMFQAKEAGKDRYAIFDAGTEEQAMARLELETALRRAFVQEELEVFFQPVVSLDDGHVHGAEALLRWNHPTLGLIRPGQFIGLAEETGLIVPLGRWVLEVACRRAREWQAHRPEGPPLVVTVNLSGRQLQHPDLRHQVEHALIDSGLPPECLCLEITESVLMDDADTTITTLEQLKRLGVRLAIDDFGTGYSSLSYLKRLPVDVVKLDQSFVAGMDESPVDAEIVAAVVKLTRTAGMQMVAEGVETTEQLEDVRALGCSLVQGYLLSRPMPNDALVRMLDDHWVAAPGLLVLPASA